jgi:DNA gyrase subunit A
VLTATENGYGKRTSIHEYTRHGRGTKGMIAIQQSRAQWQGGGRHAGACRRRNHADHRQGRAGAHPRESEIRELGRATQGVTLIGLDEGSNSAGCSALWKTTPKWPPMQRRRSWR